jgi:hypothetical protein
MSSADLHTLKEEAQRLLTLNIEILQGMLRVQGLITDSMDGSKQTFDTVSTPQNIEVLQGECTKLDKMEMVIAVVGTMKAGKSTTINAIVGTEVLPNRNRPMTALPTLIRHTPGQVEPVLKFINNQPINELFERIRQQVATGQVNQVLEGLRNDPDMSELLGNIQSRQQFGQHYQGANSIFWCLKTLNDLVRLCSQVEVAFPFASYSNVEQMPVIEVEFAHLRQAGSTQGQLTLLDTPGPNEDGQDHLRYMLKEQLRKTSAILAVFDYTQLKSDADAQVREELKHIAALHKGRLFALVNKFDQKDRNGDGKEAVQELVANTLMAGLLEKGQVFPVSSKLGYLANRARSEIEIHRKLPDAEKEAWVVDFAEEALGRRWRNIIDDQVEVLASANTLWQDSGFAEPLEDVIKVGHSKAALFALESASEKLKRCIEDVENFLNTRSGSLGKNVEELQSHIESLKKNIAEIDEIEKGIKEITLAIFERLGSQIESNIDNVSFTSGEMVQSIIENGERITQDDMEKIKKEIDKKREDRKKHRGVFIGVIFSEIFKDVMLSKKDENFSSNNYNENIIKLSNKSSANKWFSDTQKEIEKIISLQKKSLSIILEQEVNNFINEFSDSADLIKELIKDLSEALNKDGFYLKLRIPTANINKIFEYSNFSIEQDITVKTTQETYFEKRDGWWASFTNWLNDDWGKEAKTRNIEEYIIDKTKIKDIVDKKMKSVLTIYKNNIDKEIINPLNSAVDDFFSDMKIILVNIQSDFEQGIKDNQKQQCEKNLLLENISSLLKQSHEAYKDCNDLSIDVSNLKSVR